MIQTLADIRQATYNRMYLEASEYSEYDSQFVVAVNNASLEMCKRFPIQRIYELNKNITNEAGYEKFDMISATNDAGERTFMSFGENPVYKLTDDGLIPFNDYSTAIDRYLYLPNRESGVFNIHYNAYPKKITNATPHSYIMEFEPEKCALLPLLIAWQLFADDDLTRATLYYNEYGQATEDLIQTGQTTSGIYIAGGYEW